MMRKLLEVVAHNRMRAAKSKLEYLQAVAAWAATKAKLRPVRTGTTSRRP